MQAQGESAVLSPKASGESGKASYTPALPTAKGVTQTTKNGVKYEILKEGTGDELKPGRVALFRYVGPSRTARSSIAPGSMASPTRSPSEPVS